MGLQVDLTRILGTFHMASFFEGFSVEVWQFEIKFLGASGPRYENSPVGIIWRFCIYIWGHMEF